MSWISQMQLKEKLIDHEILQRPWDAVCSNMFSLNNKNYLFIVGYYSKFLEIKKMEGLSGDNLIVVV